MPPLQRRIPCIAKPNDMSLAAIEDGGTLMAAFHRLGPASKERDRNSRLFQPAHPELKKVRWPKRQEMIKYTLVVVADCHSLGCLFPCRRYGVYQLVTDHQMQSFFLKGGTGVKP